MTTTNEDAMRSAFEEWFVRAYHPAALRPMENGCYLNVHAGMPWDAWQAREPEVTALRQQLIATQAVVAELVACKALKERFEEIDRYKSTDDFRLWNDLRRDYLERKPLAWAAAKADPLDALKAHEDRIRKDTIATINRLGGLTDEEMAAAQEGKK